MKNEDLIERAASFVSAKKIKGGLSGDVACALLSEKNEIYTGVCVAGGSNVVCAEQIALGSMVTHGEYRVKKIVAVWKDEKGSVCVISPCGNCRQFVREIDEGNLETEFILDKDKSVKLKELLPYYDWWKKID